MRDRYSEGGRGSPLLCGSPSPARSSPSGGLWVRRLWRSLACCLFWGGGGVGLGSRVVPFLAALAWLVMFLMSLGGPCYV